MGRLIALVALVAACLVLATPAGAQPDWRPTVAESVKVPAYPGDFPDPFVLVDNGVYWAYSTGSAGRDLQVISSTDLRNWSQPENPLGTCPAGTTTQCGFPSWATRGFTWAPAVAKVGDQYLMYYTLRQTASDLQCVSVAVSTSPGGPFIDNSSEPLVCQRRHGGSIDASPFAVGGARYLLWKSDDNALGAQTHLWGQQLSADGLTLLRRTPTRLLDQTRSWQAPAIEGPSMIANAGSYVLFYGAGPWDSSQASIGWARCASPLGPCINQSVFGPWLASQPGAQGPSGPATFTDSAGATRFAYHAWTGAVGYPSGGVRSLFIGQLTFSYGRPVLS